MLVARVLCEVLLVLSAAFEFAPQLREAGGALQGGVFGGVVRGFGDGEFFFERGDLRFVDAAVGEEVIQRSAVAAVLFLCGVVLAVQLVVLPAL